jgi:hypothetical protein
MGEESLLTGEVAIQTTRSSYKKPTCTHIIISNYSCHPFVKKQEHIT